VTPATAAAHAQPIPGLRSLEQLIATEAAGFSDSLVSQLKLLGADLKRLGATDQYARHAMTELIWAIRGVAP
jgi:hypothetical protein